MDSVINNICHYCFFIVDYIIDDFTESKMVVLAEEIKYQTPTTHFQLSELP